MKILSVILSIHILLLTAAPSLSMVYRSAKTEHCKKTCCHSKKEKKQSSSSQENKGCCNNGVCNPFMSCCNCYALTSKLQILPCLAFANHKFYSISENSASDFLSDAWHPPRAV